MSKSKWQKTSQIGNPKQTHMIWKCLILKAYHKMMNLLKMRMRTTKVLQLDALFKL